MMFTLFTETIKNEVAERFPFYTVTVEKRIQNNGLELTGIVIKSSNPVTPTIYLDDYYSDYQNGRDIRDIVDAISDQYRRNSSYSFDAAQVTDFSILQSRLMLKLINTEMNKDLLSEIPNIKIMDLSVIFIIAVDNFSGRDGISSITVNNRMLTMWNVDTQTLYKLAKENSIKKLPPLINSMKGMIAGMIDDDEMIQEIPDSNMFVATNKMGIFGATSLLFNDFLKQASDQLGCSRMYVLPSSIHELIFIPADDDLDVTELSEMVSEINATTVAADIRLSNNVYIYDSETDSVAIAS